MPADGMDSEGLMDAFTEARLADEQRCNEAGKLPLHIVGRDLDWQVRVMLKEITDGFAMDHAYIYSDSSGTTGITMIPKIARAAE